MVLAEFGNGHFPKSEAAMRALLAALHDEFDVTSKTPDVKSARTMQMAVGHQARKRKEAEVRLRDELAEKIGGRLRDIWYLRAGLSSPLVATRTLSQFLKEFPRQETSHISPTYISACRDAMAEMVLARNRQQVREMLILARPSGQLNESQPLFFTHIHDEAAMRLRSIDSDTFAVADTYRDASLKLSSGPRPNAHPYRSRASKVQNDVLLLQIEEAQAQVFSELQPLAKKDGPTIATALLQSARRVLQECKCALDSGKCAFTEVRVLHLLTGDGVPTNENAARRMLKEILARQCDFGIRYGLLAWKCSSHVSNLLVAVAVCSGMVKRPQDHPLVATCVRVFKYLIADYVEEFAGALREFVIRNLNVIPPGPAFIEGTGAQMLSLQRLYGSEVLSGELCALLNGSLAAGNLEHIGTKDKAEIAGEIYGALYRRILKVEERPVITRFWLFSQCVMVLLSMELIGLPWDIFKVRTSSLRKDTAKRMARVHGYFNQPGTPAELRRVGFCLRLTLHSVNLAKNKLVQKQSPIQRGHRRIH